MRLISKIGNWFDQRLQLGAPIRETMEHPIPRDSASWYYVFGQRRDDRVRASACYRNPARPDLCALRRRSLEQLADSEPPGGLGMVYSRAARLGIEFHAGHRADTHGAGVPVRGLQIPQRTDLDSRRVPAADDTRDGVHRSGAAIRPGCLLGTGDRSVHLQPRAIFGGTRW